MIQSSWTLFLAAALLIIVALPMIALCHHSITQRSADLNRKYQALPTGVDKLSTDTPNAIIDDFDILRTPLLEDGGSDSNSTAQSNQRRDCYQFDTRSNSSASTVGATKRTASNSQSASASDAPPCPAGAAVNGDANNVSSPQTGAALDGVSESSALSPDSSRQTSTAGSEGTTHLAEALASGASLFHRMCLRLLLFSIRTAAKLYLVEVQDSRRAAGGLVYDNSNSTDQSLYGRGEVKNTHGLSDDASAPLFDVNLDDEEPSNPLVI